MEFFNEIVKNITKFSNDSEFVKAVVMIGSQARNEFGADKYSDLDIILIVNDTDYFLNSDAWLKNIGDFKISFTENSLGGTKERRVMFDGAKDVDFIIYPFDDKKDMDSEIFGIFKRGYKILVDKIGITDDILKKMTNIPVKKEILMQNEFDILVNDFWFHSVWSAKKLLRGELWSAKFCVDSYMKRLLLKIIEWHSYCENGWDYEIWHDGRFIDKWANDRVTEKFSEIFSHYEKSDIKIALFATMDLFRMLAIEIAQKLDYSYSFIADENAVKWVNELFRERI